MTARTAEAMCALVRGVGLFAQVVAVRAIELLVARKFELGPAALGVESREGAAAQIPFAAIDVLLRGVRQIQRTQTEKVSQKKVAIDRMILSGGLIKHAHAGDDAYDDRDDVDELVVVFAGAEAPWARAPQATWDERLVRPASQSQMLGPTLRGEEHLEFLIGLVAASVRARGGPYRSPAGS